MKRRRRIKCGTPSSDGSGGGGGDAEFDGTRGSVTLSSVPVGYRRVKNRKTVPSGVFMDMQVFQFETKTSLKKCPQSHKNQERIFVPGDIIGIIMTFDPFVHEDDVWFIVTKRKNGSKRLWKRKWSDLRTKITVAPTLACEEVPVCEIGTVGEDPKVRHFVCLRDAQCFCVKIGDGSRQNTLWVEIGLFRVWSSAGVDVDEIVFSHYSATSMALKKECGDGGGSDSKEQNVLTGNFPEHSEISTTEINSVNNKSNEITEKKNPGTVITSEN